MTMDSVRKKVLVKMENLVELFCMETDALLLVARHFKWNEEQMQTDWFSKQDTLKFSLGVEFDPKITQTNPHT